MAVFAPVIASHDPFKVTTEVFVPPCSEHLFGTDDLGRDVFSGVVYGARGSMLIGFLAAGLSSLIGVIIGSISGYVGGRMDDLLMRISEMFQVIPQFFLVLLFAVLFGRSIWIIALGVGAINWPITARLVRVMVLSLKEKPFVEASRALGASAGTILFGDILPNAISPAIVQGSLQIGRAIILEAGLSFLGLGDPSLMSWGYQLFNSQQFLRRAWWTSILPGLVLSMTVLALVLLGDGLNEVLNPRYRKR